MYYLILLWVEINYYYDFIRIIVKIIVKPSPPISGERCTEGYGFDDLILYFAYKIV
jgi:hypothetical protein